MTIGVKVMKRPEAQVSYVRAALKGMGLTFKKLFEPNPVRASLAAPILENLILGLLRGLTSPPQRGDQAPFRLSTGRAKKLHRSDHVHARP